MAVGDPSKVPDWAVPYESVATVTSSLDFQVERRPNDVMLQYTGGTTGMPKGVMWAHEDLFRAMGSGGNALLGMQPISSLDALAERNASPSAPNPVALMACPLMHATAFGNTLQMLGLGATIVLLENRRFDPAELWSAVEDNGVTWLTMVGDAFGRPLLAELEASPGRWNLESLRVVYSAGVMWSEEVKKGMLRHLPPEVTLLDALGSSEAPGLGASVTNQNSTAHTAQFTIGEHAQVISDDDQFVEPGSGEIGMVAFGGPMPLGYYKDEAKTASTFRTVGGRRWSIPGDYATVEVDGTLNLLGRGSVCINTGGEKVFPEEVEEILKLSASVHDAVCVGVPDDRFGQRICAIVEPEPGADIPDLATLAELTKSRLAGYKAPRELVIVDTIGRAPSGKVDYKGLTALAAARLAEGGSRFVDRPLTERAAIVRGEIEALSARFAALDEADLDRAAIGAWTVGEVIGHLAVVAEFYADSIRRGATGDAGVAGNRPAAGTGRGEIAARGIKKRATEVAAESDVRERFLRSAQALVDEVDPARGRTEADVSYDRHHPGGIVVAHRFLVLFLKEMGLHEWDIFEALSPPCSMGRWGVDAAFRAMEEELASGSLRWVTTAERDSGTLAIRIVTHGAVAAERDLIFDEAGARLIPVDTNAEPDRTLTFDAADFVLACSGRLDPAEAVRSGRVQGAVAVAESLGGRFTGM